MFVPLQYSHRNRQYQALSVRHWYSSKSNLESSKVVGNFSLWGRTDRVWDFPSAEISLRSDLCFLTRPSGQRLLLESTTWTFANGVSGMSRSWPDKKRRENQNTGCKWVQMCFLCYFFLLKFCMSSHSKEEEKIFIFYVLCVTEKVRKVDRRNCVLPKRSERWILIIIMSPRRVHKTCHNYFSPKRPERWLTFVIIMSCRIIRKGGIFNYRGRGVSGNYPWATGNLIC